MIGVYKGIQGVTKGYKGYAGLQGDTGGYKGLHGVTSGYRGLDIHTYIHTLLARPHRAFQSQFLHYKIINQVHDKKNITMIKEDKGQ